MVYNIHFSVVNVSTGIYNSLKCYRGIKMQKEKNLSEVCRVPSLIFRILKKTAVPFKSAILIWLAAL